MKIDYQSAPIPRLRHTLWIETALILLGIWIASGVFEHHADLSMTSSSIVLFGLGQGSIAVGMNQALAGRPPAPASGWPNVSVMTEIPGYLHSISFLGFLYARGRDFGYAGYWQHTAIRVPLWFPFTIAAIIAIRRQTLLRRRFKRWRFNNAPNTSH